MRGFAASVLIAVAFLFPTAPFAEECADDFEVLVQILRRPNAEGHFTVVVPLATLWHLSEDTTAEEQARVKEHLLEQLDVRIDGLFDLLVEKNMEPAKLEILSSPKDGYVFDHDGKFRGYFEPNGGGWERWHEENPRARGLTRISRPAYDPETGLLLVYEGTQSDWLIGSGHLILFRCQDGKLKELGRVLLWVS